MNHIFGNGPGQIPLGSTIHTATLKTQTGAATYDGTSPVAVTALHRLLVPFADSNTWNNSFGGDGVTLDGNEAVAAPEDTRGPSEEVFDGELVPWDVTASVQALSDGAQNNGWVLLQSGASSTTNQWYFSSAEGADPPVLQIEFTPVPEPSTLMLAVIGFGVMVGFRRRRHGSEL